MRRFQFITGTVPTVGGEGVRFDDGTTAYRKQITDGTETDVISGSVKDIQDQYSGQGGYVFSWQDQEPGPPLIMAPVATVTGLVVKLEFGLEIDPADGSVDWGDGSKPDTFIGLTGELVLNHTYVAGDYTVKIKATNAQGDDSKDLAVKITK